MSRTPTLTIRIPRRLAGRATSENVRRAVLSWQQADCPTLPAIAEPRRAVVCVSLSGFSREKLDRVAAGRGMNSGELLYRILLFWCDRDRRERKTARVEKTIARAVALPGSRGDGTPAAGRDASISQAMVAVALDWLLAQSLLRRAGIPADARPEFEYFRVGDVLAERAAGKVVRQWQL